MCSEFIVILLNNHCPKLPKLLPFVMITSFSTGVILLELDLLLLKQGFTDFQKLLLSDTSLIFVLLKYGFSDFLRRVTQ